MKNWPAAAAIAVLTLLSFYQFPGHTWLQQDSQIYVPILEHLRDPTMLANDILVERPHVTFTLYDEIALGLRRATGLGFREILEGQQFVTRALGIWGFYLLATAAGLETAAALLVTAILSLGAMIAGPQVLIFEFEPVPRAFAVPLLVLATGLAVHRRFLAAGIAGSVAFLIHPPTVFPFWAVYGCYAAREFWRKRDPGEPSLQAFVPLVAAAAILFAAARWQSGESEAQDFFTRVTPLMEKLQRMRTPYVWISTWWKDGLAQYLLVCALATGATVRIRQRMKPELRFFLAGLVTVGVLSMPLSWLLLEEAKWALMPQLQPLRALLFVTLCAIFAAACAGCVAAENRRYLEAFAWFAAAYLAPVNTSVTTLPAWPHAAVVLLLAALATGAMRLKSSLWGGPPGPRPAPWPASGNLAQGSNSGSTGTRADQGVRPTIAIAAVAGFFLIPWLGGVVNYPKLHTAELEQLAGWARSSTPRDAVFLFPNFGKDLSPGVFRAEALRAVYVDWKGGGQVNYLKELGEQWWSRWQIANRTLPPDEYRKAGIDYLVVHPSSSEPGTESLVFRNAQFAVYRLRR
jgi:hypothetical protein